VPEQAAAGEPLSLAFLGDVDSVHFRRWVEFMAARGHRVTLLVAEGRDVAPGLSAGIAIERFTPFMATKIWPLGVLRARRSLRHVLDRVRPDVLNAHFLTVHGYHAWMSGFHPYAVTVWGSDVLVMPRRSRFAAIVGRVALRAADMVMANSEHLRAGALALGAAPEKLEMVQWGVDLERFTPGPDPVELRRGLGLTGRRVVLSPRILRPIYNQRAVVEALAQLPADVSVVMSDYRADAEEVARVRTRAKELGVADRLLIVPAITDAELADYYRLADVVVSIPSSDSTSVSILESLACGRMIVAGDLPSVREWLGDLDEGSLVPIGDAAATAAALSRALARPPAERAELGRRARRIVESRADRSRSLSHVEELYRALAARAGREPSR
jgi:glycosyltransferase involved in cell wall biosynthesis